MIRAEYGTPSLIEWDIQIVLLRKLNLHFCYGSNNIVVAQTGDKIFNPTVVAQFFEVVNLAVILKFFAKSWIQNQTSSRIHRLIGQYTKYRVLGLVVENKLPAKLLIQKPAVANGKTPDCLVVVRCLLVFIFERDHLTFPIRLDSFQGRVDVVAGLNGIKEINLVSKLIFQATNKNFHVDGNSCLSRK